MNIIMWIDNSGVISKKYKIKNIRRIGIIIIIIIYYHLAGCPDSARCCSSTGPCKSITYINH